MFTGNKKVLDRIRAEKAKDRSKWALIIQNLCDQYGLVVSHNMGRVGPLAPFSYKQVVVHTTWSYPLTRAMLASQAVTSSLIFGFFCDFVTFITP